MAPTVREIMTEGLTTCPPDATLADVSRMMRDNEIGDVLVVDNGELAGIVTDRDVVVRGLANGSDAGSTIEGTFTPNPVCVAPETALDDVAKLMRTQTLRRVPVVEGRRLVGIVSLGDLAERREPDSTLATISAAPADS